MSTKVRDIILKKVFDAMEAGINWIKPWAGVNAMPRNGFRNTPYRGINLWLTLIMGSQFSAPIFLTLKEIKKLGGTVKTDEFKKSLPILFAGKVMRKDKVTGEETSGWTSRFYNVYNIDQTEGVKLPKKTRESLTIAEHTHNPSERAEAIIAAMPNAPKIDFVQGSDRACYNPSTDTITMPTMGQFKNLNEYYGVLFHEIAHSTGARNRLDRDELRAIAGFGDHAYSAEELCAELTACILCSEAGIEPNVNNSAAYVAGWHKALKRDPDILLKAASKAQKAADYVLGTTFNAVSA